MEIFLMMVVKPFLLLLLVAIAQPFKWAVQRYMKDGELKRKLLS